MVDRMWLLDEVKLVIGRLQDCKLEGIYDENFSLITDDYEPSLAYFVLKNL